MALVEKQKSSLNQYFSENFTGSLSDYAKIALMVDELIQTGVTDESLRALMISAVQNRNLNHPLSVQGEVSSLTIDFWENRLVTVLHGERQELKLSNALGISMNLYEIFSHYVDDRSAKELEFSSAFESSSETKFQTNGRSNIEINPDIQRVTLTTSLGQSSIPFAMLKALVPLFKKEMFNDLCPHFKGEPSAFTLLSGIRLAYIGRCMVGAAKALSMGRNREECVREFTRTIHLLKGGYAFFTEPLA